MRRDPEAPVGAKGGGPWFAAGGQVGGSLAVSSQLVELIPAGLDHVAAGVPVNLFRLADDTPLP